MHECRASHRRTDPAHQQTPRCRYFRYFSHQGFCNLAGEDVVDFADMRHRILACGGTYAANRQWPEAMSAYRKAAHKRSTAAMVKVGLLLAVGSSVPKDEA